MRAGVDEKTSRASALPPAERRAAIVTAVLPLLVERGGRVTTREIAEAAGIAEGTIFGVFADKDELLAAALDAALDTVVFEDELSQIDRCRTFEAQLTEATTIIQRRIVDVWSIYSGIESRHRPDRRTPPADSPELVSIFTSEADRLRMDPDEAARLLRALTLSLTHPMLNGAAASAEHIVDVVLHGIHAGGGR